MANLVEHMIINKWDDDINNAITHVGGDTQGSAGLPDYANIIKSQLTSNNAIGEGVYQDFLYTNEDGETSIHPWEGEPTNSTNATQSTAVANSIKELFNIMVATERFQTLVVDEFPVENINTHAVYLVQSKCDCGEENIEEDTYTGCYYLKIGEDLRRIDIPEFKININELFYLTRSEYNKDVFQIQNLEDTLSKKFGEHWNDEDFTVETLVKDTIEIGLQDYTQELYKEFLSSKNALTLEELNKILV